MKKYCEEHEDCIVVFEEKECPICRQISDLENSLFEESMGEYL